MKAIKPAEGASEFETKAQGVAKRILGNFKDYEFVSPVPLSFHRC